MLILFARHAERDDYTSTAAWSKAWWDAHASERPWDPSLSTGGRVQASHLGSLIQAKLDAHSDTGGKFIAFTSPFKRCFETLSGVLVQVTRTTECVVDNSLCEHLRSDWFDAATATMPDFLLTGEVLVAAQSEKMAIPAITPFAPLSPVSYPEGDGDLFVRAQHVATSLVALERSGTHSAVLVVTHGGVLLAFVRALAAACGMGDIGAPHQGFGSLTTLSLDSTSRSGSDGGTSKLTVHGLAELPLRLSSHQLWFAGQEPVWHAVLLPRIQKRKEETGGAISVLELGSWEGASSTWLLRNACDASPASQLTCVDHFDQLRTLAGAERAAKFSYNTRLTGLWPRVDLRIDFTVAALSRLLTERREWDLIYVDASHEAADTLLDAMLAWKGLKQGGILVFDDYEWPEKPHDSPLHPKPGIDAFLHVHAHELEMVHKGYQVMVMKLVPPRFNF